MNTRAAADHMILKRMLQIITAMTILEKDPCVSCITVHNKAKADFVADDILRAVRFLPARRTSCRVLHS